MSVHNDGTSDLIRIFGYGQTNNDYIINLNLRVNDEQDS